MASPSDSSPPDASPPDASHADGDLSMTKLVGGMAVFVLLGFPLVGYLWSTLNDLLALEVDATRLLIAVPVAALLVVLLWFLRKAVERWHGAEDAG